MKLKRGVPTLLLDIGGQKSTLLGLYILLRKAMWRNCTTILRNTKSDVQKSGNIRKGEVINTPGCWEYLLGVFTPKCIYGIEFYSSENCCYGYQIQINNQFMPLILFNFIVFSNTQNFLYFSEHGVAWS